LRERVRERVLLASTLTPTLSQRERGLTE